MALSCNQYPLIVQRLEKILAQNAAPKVLEWPSYGIFGKVTQKTHFLKKERRGDPGKFFKNRTKTSPRLKGPKALWRKLHSTLISMHFQCKYWRRFCRRKRLQKRQMAQLWQFRQGHPKPTFSEKVQRADQGKFFKNRPRSSLRLKGPKGLWRKKHYPQTSMHLKCKDWRRFWRRTRLRKCPNGRVMAIFARSP